MFVRGWGPSGELDSVFCFAYSLFVCVFNIGLSLCVVSVCVCVYVCL